MKNQSEDVPEQDEERDVNSEMSVQFILSEDWCGTHLLQLNTPAVPVWPEAGPCSERSCREDRSEPPGTAGCTGPYS